MRLPWQKVVGFGAYTAYTIAWGGLGCFCLRVGFCLFKLSNWDPKPK